MAIAYYQPSKNKQQGINKKKYWIARFARIYPVYLLALLIIVAAKYKTLGEQWETLPLHLFLLQSWFPGYPITLNTPGWSLSVEAFFYLCFPFLLIWVYKHGIKALTIFCIILWLTTQIILMSALNSEAYAPKTNLHDFIYYNPVMHLSSFIMGMLVGINYKQSLTQNTQKQKNTSFLLFFSFAIIFILIWARPHLELLFNYKLAYTNGLLAPVFLYFIVILAMHKGSISRIFSHPWLILLGEASYSLYILQKPIHGLYDKIITPRIALPETVHFYLFLVGLILVSIISYKFLEKPMRQTIRAKFR